MDASKVFFTSSYASIVIFQQAWISVFLKKAHSNRWTDSITRTRSDYISLAMTNMKNIHLFLILLTEPQNTTHKVMMYDIQHCHFMRLDKQKTFLVWYIQVWSGLRFLYLLYTSLVLYDNITPYSYIFISFIDILSTENLWTKIFQCFKHNSYQLF